MSGLRKSCCVCSAMNSLPTLLENGAVGVEKRMMHVLFVFEWGADEGCDCSAIHNLSVLLKTRVDGEVKDVARAVSL